MDGYISTIDGLEVTNTFDIGSKDIPVEKFWINGPEAKPEITINLLADGVEVAEVTLKDGETSHTFTGLPIYNSDGTTIDYTLTEDEVEGYITSIDGFEITNKFDEGSRDISVEKTWVNGPKSKPEITINLLADGQKVDYVTLKGGKTSHTFTGLPIYYADGTTIVYTITEDAVAGYITTIDGFKVTNRFDQGSRDIPVKKIWIDGPKKKPEITVNLLADGIEVAEVILKNGKTTHTFKELPIFNADGTTIVYTITEDKVEDYKTTIEGFTVTNRYTGDLPNAGTTPTTIPIVGAVMALAGLALTLKKKRS